MQIRKTAQALTLALVPLTFISCRDNTSKPNTVPIVTTESTGDFYTDSLIKKLNDKNSEVRADAVKQLGQTKTPTVVKFLLNALHDEDSVVCENAAAALGNMKSKEAIQPLIKLALDNNQNNSLKARVIEALGNIGDESATEVLCNLLTYSITKDHGFYGYLLATALEKINDERAIPILVSALIDGGNGSEDAFAKAINSIGKEEAIQILNGYLSNETNLDNVIKAFGFLEAKETVPTLIPFLNHKNEDVRRATVQAFINIKDERTIKPLCDRFPLEREHIQREIIEALTETKSSEAVLPLIEFINNDSSYVRGDIARALGVLKDKRATETLVNRLKFDDNPLVRMLCAKALGKIDDPQALSALIEVKETLEKYQGNKDFKRVVNEAINYSPNKIK